MGKYTQYLVATDDETQLKIFFQSDVERYNCFLNIGVVNYVKANFKAG